MSSDFGSGNLISNSEQTDTALGGDPTPENGLHNPFLGAVVILKGSKETWGPVAGDWFRAARK
jgi:hypothetical protein